MDDTKVEIIDSSQALSVVTRAEIDMQIATAKQYPRDIQRSLARVEALVLSSPEIAESCIYKKPAGKDRETGKPVIVEGKSVRFAEIAAQAWGNLRIGAKQVGADATHVTVESVVHDLETNVAYKIEKKGRITTKDGHRYSDDMITNTINGLCSKAKRDAIFNAIPDALIKQVENKAKALIRGDIDTNKDQLVEARNRALALFKAYGKTQAEVCSFLGHTEIGEINADDIMLLRGIYNAIKDGELKPENCFDIAPDGEEGVKYRGNAELKAKLAKQK